MVRHLAAGKQTYHMSVNLPLDESFGSCLMPSRADINVECCRLDQLIHQHCTSKPLTADKSSTVSATEVEFFAVVFATKCRLCFVILASCLEGSHQCLALLIVRQQGVHSMLEKSIKYCNSVIKIQGR